MDLRVRWQVVVALLTTCVGTGVLCAAPPAKPVSPVAGWRTDTTGYYPHATPPLHWSATTNVAWKAPMPGKSAATPILVPAGTADRIIVMSDPNGVICLDKKTGKELWKHECKIEGITDKASLARVQELAGEGQKLDAEIKDLKGRKGAEDAKLKQNPNDADAKTKAAELDKQIKEAEKKKQGVPKAASIKANGGVGDTCCTPVSDGRILFCLFHSGVGVCLDLDGNVKWSRMIRPVSMGYGQSMSPALGGDVIGVHMDEEFFGLDVATGKTLWTGRETQHQGSPVAVKVGEMYVFLGTDGSVFRARDGKVLTKFGFPALNRFSTPCVFGNTAYWISEDKMLVTCAFEPKAADDITAKKGHRGIPNGTFYASPVIFGDKALVWDNVDYKRNRKNVSVLDLKTGQVVIKQQALPNVRNWAYPSPSYAGGFLYVSGCGGDTGVYVLGTQSVETGPGTTRKDPVLKEIAVNRLEDDLRACLVFEQDRLYIRGGKALYCVQASADDRKAAAELLK